MQVKQRLRINSIIMALLVASVFVVLFSTTYRVIKAMEQTKIADALVTAQFERLAFRTDYLRTGSERAREQVSAKFSQISELLRSASDNFTSPRDKVTIDALIEGQESIGKIFRTIVENRKNAGLQHRSANLSREIEYRLLNQLDIRVYEAVLLGGKLQKSSNESLGSALRLAGGGILFVLLLLGAAIAVNSWMMSTAISDRISLLRDGVSVIGAGNLNHRIDITGDDEFAELSNVFNTMTGKLRASHAELKSEIETRKQAEKALRKAYDESEMIVKERTKELAAAVESAVTERQRLYDVLETLPVYVILLTEDHYVPFANRFFRDRFGESLGRRCYEYLFNRTEPCETCETYSVLKTNAPHHWEWDGPDGRNYDIHDYPFIDTDGSRLVLEMGIDITEQKNAKAELLELSRTQEQRIMERTAELHAANETLRASRVAALNLIEDALEARKKAEAASEELQNEIAERRRVDEALKASEAKYRLLFENMIDGFALHRIVVDDNGNPVDYIFLEANSAFERLTGLSRSTIIGKRVTEVIPGIGKDPADWIGTYGKVAKTGNSREFEQYAEALGKWFAVSAFSPIEDHFATIFVDITERKRAEREVLKLTEDLTARNQELEFANSELEAFIYSVSHDLRAPLRIMGGFAKALEEDCAVMLDERGMDYLARIGKSSLKMTRLIDELLNLSRISRQRANRIMVDMSALASSAVSILRDSEPGRSVSVSIQEGLTASADPILMELVLANLFGNAWKFTSKIYDAKIEFGAIDKDGRTMFFIRDNGAGFDPSHKEKLFLPFQRLHSEKEFEGTGIGLAIVERIIRIHGGRVWAEGEAGKGAAIYFTL